MSEWKEYRLGDCIEAIVDNRGKSAPTKQTGEFPLLEINSIGGYYPNYGVVRKHVDEITYKTWFRSGHPESGDILVPTVGTIGIISIMDSTKACIAQNLIALRIKKDISNVFVYYYLKSPIVKKELLNLDIGGVQPSIKVPHLLNLSISLPPKEMQIRIASILSSLDDKIDLLHRENATLEQMAETLFRQWFVEEVKEEWTEGKLGDILTVKGGTTPSTKEPSFWDGDIAWTSPRDVTTLKGLYLFETEKTITQKGLEQISSGLLPSGTLLMSSRAPVGVLAFTEIPLAINQGYIAILDDKGYPKEFIYLWLKSNMDLIHSYSNGSTFLEISKSAFKSLDVSIPSKGEVNCFVSEVKPYFYKIRTNEIQIRTLSKTREGLLPKLMSNQITL